MSFEISKLKSRKFISVPIIIVISLIVAFTLIVFKKVPPKSPPRSSAPLVKVIQSKPMTTQISISGYGTVESKQMIELRSQVSGYITEVNQNFQEGGRIKAGEVILKIDDRDYQSALAQAKAQLAKAEFELKLEEGNQIVAQKEWELLNKDFKKSTVGEDLVLRKPHLAEKQAALTAAQSQLSKAELDLQRTSITAPYDLIILEKLSEVGKFINSQTPIGTVAGTKTFQIIVRLPRKDLDSLAFNGNPNAYDSHVEIYQTFSDKHIFTTTGKLIRFLGDVDKTGRMAQVLVEVHDPLDSINGNTPLLIGSFVRVDFQGKKIADVYELPRESLRENSQIWTLENSKLKKVDVEEIFTEGDKVFVRANLKNEITVITTAIKTALDGMNVKTSE
ncbi:MAG: efflux RND transporter periplasmic adaptor subunit [Bdellovibrionales bacterium]|nr:efflux RND transporter periplasmic adaptor subunit [Bdellovibrionales bacterium]